MILWLIGLVLLASVAIVGFYQGALRAAFSTVGLLLAALLAGPVGSLLKSVIPILGLKNPVVIAFIAPILAFLIILILFKCAALAVHKKAEAWYKYKGSDTERLMWERMNARVGIAAGLANGLIYFFVLCTLVYSIGFLTTQVATEQDGWTSKLVNRLTNDIKNTGMNRAVAPFMTKSELYYDGSDIIADMYHTPLLQNRLANYPPFLLVGEKDEFKPLSDPSLQSEWLKGSLTFGGFIGHEKVKPLVENNDVVTNVLAMLGGDFKDLKVYLETGKSPKYDDEKILGRWELDVKASMNAARRKTPNMGSAAITRLRTVLATFQKSALIATVDNKAILKLAGGGDKAANRGTWKNVDGKYFLTINQDGKNMEIEAKVEGRTITFTWGAITLVCENTRV